MRRGRALLLLALLLAGCTGDPPAPPAPGPDATVALVSIDGRWDFDAAAAARLAGPPDAGRLWLGEASGGAAAGDAWGMDAAAARLLDAPAPPPPGAVVMREDAARAAGRAPGDEVEVRAWAWPAPLVTAAFEMDRVRPCDPAAPAQLCSERTTPDGRARLALQVPPGARDLRYHPDVVELRDADYPAYWEGEFIAPDGARVPFRTAARTRADLDPPGHLPGPAAEGAWAIEFTLTLNGTRAPGAVAGFVSFRTPGFGPFDTDLLREASAGRQTARALADAVERAARLRIASLAPANGTLGTLGAALLLAPEDARALLGVAEGNATALAVPYARGDEARLAAAAADAASPTLRALRARPHVPADPALPAGGVAWAPAGNATLFASRVPPGGTVDLNGTRLAPGVRLLSFPTSAPPWTLAPGSRWADAEEAARGIAGSAHLVLVSADLAREAGLDPARVEYAQLQVESGLGPRTLFVMGAVEGGPPRAVWASAALLTVLSMPAGGRTLGEGVPLV